MKSFEENGESVNLVTFVLYRENGFEVLIVLVGVREDVRGGVIKGEGADGFQEGRVSRGVPTLLDNPWVNNIKMILRQGKQGF